MIWLQKFVTAHVFLIRSYWYYSLGDPLITKLYKIRLKLFEYIYVFLGPKR